MTFDDLAVGADFFCSGERYLKIAPIWCHPPDIGLPWNGLLMRDCTVVCFLGFENVECVVVDA